MGLGAASSRMAGSMAAPSWVRCRGGARSRSVPKLVRGAAAEFVRGPRPSLFEVPRPSSSEDRGAAQHGGEAARRHGGAQNGGETAAAERRRLGRVGGTAGTWRYYRQRREGGVGHCQVVRYSGRAGSEELRRVSCTKAIMRQTSCSLCVCSRPASGIARLAASCGVLLCVRSFGSIGGGGGGGGGGRLGKRPLGR